MTKTYTVEDVKSQIRSAVNEWWSTHKKAYLLSALGIRLGPMNNWIRAHQGMRIRDFVVEHMYDELELIPNPEHPSIYGIVPKAAHLSGSSNELFDTQAQPRHMATRRPSYHPEFWSAFRLPLQEGKRRFILQTEEGCRVVEQDEDVHPPASGVEIDRKWIIERGVTYSPRDIYNAIDGWSKENNIDITKFTLAGLDDPAASRLRISHSLLDRLLSTLSEDDLRRLTLPGDLIKKLARS